MTYGKIINILIIEANNAFAEYLSKILTDADISYFKTTHIFNIDELHFTSEQNITDVILININFFKLDYLAVIKQLENTFPSVLIVGIITEKGATQNQVVPSGIECFCIKHSDDDLFLAKFVYLIIEKTRLTQAIRVLYAQRYNIAHDGLTGLPNKLYLYKAINYFIKHSEKKEETFALALIDLDNFANVNHIFGHANGDNVLKTIAHRLSMHINNSDVIARVGDDEFVVMLTNIDNGEQAHKLCIDLQNIIKAEINIDGKQFSINATIGITLYPYDGNNVEDLINNANIIMRLLKKHNFGLCGLYKNIMNIHDRANMKLSNDIKEGLKNNEFLLYFQPQIDFATNNIVGVEVLLRWQHRISGLLTPAKFLPFAEKAGFGLPLDMFVFREAFKWYSELSKDVRNELMLTINISTNQILNNGFADGLIILIKEYDLDPNTIEVDISEQIFETGVEYSKQMELSRKVIVGTIEQSIKTLKNFGLHIAVHDFGIGYSPISYLELLTIDTVKINSAYIQNLTYNYDAANIVKHMNTIAKSLALKFVAVGVEEQEQAEFLFELGCQYMQGEYFFKPMPGADVIKLINNRFC